MYKERSRRRNITKESKVYPSKVYPLEQKRNSKANQRSKNPLWQKVKATVVESLQYVERRPVMNFQLFAIAQLFAGAGLASLVAVSLLVLAMISIAARVYKSREFIWQGIAICGGLAIARIIQAAIIIMSQ
jgi:hypothetical protein